MVSHIEDFETIVTDNELEALILECNLIKNIILNIILCFVMIRLILI